MENSFFPQFDKDFYSLGKSLDSTCVDPKPTFRKMSATPDLPKFQPLVFNQPPIFSPQIPTVTQSDKDLKKNVFDRARRLAKKYKGECQSTSGFSICKGKNSIKFRCLNGHTFYVAVDILDSKDKSQDEWCYKCKKFFDCCKDVADQHDIKVVNGLYSSKITLKCDKRGHEFKISYAKKLNSLSCCDCRREEREEWKAKLRQEEIDRNEMFERQQRELFEQAKRDMDKEGGSHHQGQYYYQQPYFGGAYWQYQSSSQPSSSSSSNSSSRGPINYYAALEEQANN